MVESMDKKRRSSAAGAGKKSSAAKAKSTVAKAAGSVRERDHKEIAEISYAEEYLASEQASIEAERVMADLEVS